MPPVLPEPSQRARELARRVNEFVEDRIYPAEAVFARQLAEGPERWRQPAIMEELKTAAKAAGL